MPGFQDDVPASIALHTKRYEVRWGLHTGSPLDSMLHDPVWLQHVKRWFFVPWFVLRRVRRRLQAP